MKKRLLTITAFVVSLGILNPLSCFAFERTDDEYGTIVANLESDSYGGAYIKDGVLHIKPLSEQIKPRLVKTSGNAQVVFDDIAQYSMEELNKAMEESVVLFDELDIDFVGIDEENNGLRVGMIDVTEEKKERFCHEIAIDNILFEEVSAIESPVENSNYAETDMGAERAADNEIHNIQVIKRRSVGDKILYEFTTISKEKLRIFKESIKCFEKILGRYIYINDEYINIYEQVMSNFLNNKNQYELLYILTNAEVNNSINAGYKRYILDIQINSMGGLKMEEKSEIAALE